jgi:Asp-tRNA(Asn)/Glu-tRNA(Gln) amidotransferase A subunit family amidase
MDFAQYAGQDAVGLAQLVRDRQVTPAELLDAARARAAAVNPRINAIVRSLDDQADARVADGELRGPLAGVPFLLKDLHQDYAGVPTSQGSRSLADVPATEHATVVRRWLEAGLVIFGKTNTPEFGSKGITEPELFGPTRNPWRPDHTPGGSSGGAAVAVAAGIIPCAAASDGGGSIRIPASCCGLFGLKPGRGLVPSGPAMSEGLHGSAVQGVISRTVRDTAAMLDVLAGPDAVSPYVAAVSATPYADEVGADPGRLRIGMQTTSALNGSPDPEARAAVEHAARELEALGHHVEPVERVPWDERALAADFLTTWFVAAAQAVARAKALSGRGDDAFEQDTLITAALGRATRVVDYADALDRRHDYVRALAAFHADYDLLLTPTTATPPPRVGAFASPPVVRALGDVVLRLRGAGHLRHTPIVANIIDRNLGWVPFTQLANLTGRPAMSVPLHRTAAGLPIGAQLVAPLGGEGLLLRLAAQLEQARPWWTGPALG